MINLRGKKLLVMCGVRPACNIVKTAKKLGIYVIVTDYLEDSPAKKIADESYMISTTDIKGLVQLSKELKVNGVFCGYIESMMIYCQKVCEILGFPFYASEKQINILTNKREFKDVCHKYNLPVIKEYGFDDVLKKEGLDKIIFPVVTKPSDSGGSKGIFISYNKDEFINNYHKSIEYSRSKKVIVEKFMAGDEVVMYYTIQDGYISLSAMCDRFTNKNQLGVAQIPTAYIFPSKYLKSFQKKDNNNIKNMISSLGIKNGVLFIQSFVENRRVCLYESGFRFAGAQGHKIIKAVNGIDTMEMMIRYSLTGKMEGWDIKKDDNPNFKKWACKLTPIVKPGIIHRIEGLEDIAKYPGVFDITPVHEVGDKISLRGTLDQLLTRIFIIANNKQELKSTINKINENLRVTNINGENMLLKPFDTKYLDKFY